jgi:hypothetical protein
MKTPGLQMNSSRIASYGLLAIIAVAQSIPARADESPAQNKVIINDPDDRLSSVPTNWWTYSRQSLQDVTDTTSARNARIVDISVEQIAPSFLFTVTYVENAGPYYKPGAWYAGIDAAGLANALSHEQRALDFFEGIRCQVPAKSVSWPS